jgi:hypothetical protein
VFAYYHFADRNLKEYRIKNPLKTWDFPKAHTHQHLFRDIMMKGVTRNYNTKPGEKMNGPLKKFYQNHTNFKNVAPLGIATGMVNPRVNATGSSGVRVRVKGLCTLQNPYPAYGYGGYRAEKGHPNSATNPQTSMLPF